MLNRGAVKLRRVDTNNHEFKYSGGAQAASLLVSAAQPKRTFAGETVGTFVSIRVICVIRG